MDYAIISASGYGFIVLCLLTLAVYMIGDTVDYETWKNDVLQNLRVNTATEPDGISDEELRALYETDLTVDEAVNEIMQAYDFGE